MNATQHRWKLIEYITIALLGAAIAMILCGDAKALPAFARQTGQACEMCHVGAFGPQLKPYGRDFKLYGYTASDGSTGHFPPLAIVAQGSFTRTDKDQPTPTAPNTGIGTNQGNNNFEFDQVNLFYAGRVTPTIGAFAAVTYDGVADRVHWDYTDIRHAERKTLFGKPIVLGITVNNQPTVQDLWNSTPAWGFPFANSPVAPNPAASTLIDNNLAQLVLGTGVYAMWNRWVFLEFDAYDPLNKDQLTMLGIPTGGLDKYRGLIPYWRAAVQHQFGDHYFEVGAYGISAYSFPGGDESAGMTDRKTDVAFDANYQWAINPSNFLSAHTTYIHENLNLNASSIIAGSNPSDTLNTYRADISYSYKDTYIPSVQYFQTWGSSDAAYWGTANGNPDNAGYVVELAYVPFGKTDSIIHFANMRLTLQYKAYTKFDGTSSHASDNNTLLLNLWVAGAPW